MPVMSTVAKVKLRKRFEVGSSDNTGSAGETQRFSKVKWDAPQGMWFELLRSSSNHNLEGSEGVSEGSESGDEISDGDSLTRFL